MYCRKCGREIKENSMFCPYCGYDLKKGRDKTSDAAKQNAQLQKTDKFVSHKKRIIPVAIAAGTIIIAVVVFLGVKAMRKPEEALKEEAAKEVPSKAEAVKGSIEEEKEPVEEEHAEYPLEISLDENIQQEIIKFLELLCEVDTAGSEGDNINRMYSCTIDDAFAYSFIFQSLSNEISFVKDETFSGWSVPEEILTEYLQNSINHPEYECNPNGVKIANGIVTFEMASGEMLGYKYNTPKIEKIIQISEDEIELTGYVDYTPAEMEGYQPYTGKFDIVMFEKPESLWGGYTLKEIKSWGRQDGGQVPGNSDKLTGDWKQAFISYINPADLHAKTSDYPEEDYNDKPAFKLWDMDQDGVPEVVCSYGGGSAASSVLLAYNPQSNMIVENGLGRFLTYRGTELCGGNSHNGVGYFIVYTKSEDGSLNENFVYEFRSDVASDSYEVHYYCNEFEITEKEYQQFSDKFSQPLEMDLTYDRLIQEIQNYTQ